MTDADAEGIHRPRRLDYRKPDGTFAIAMAQPRTPLDRLAGAAENVAMLLLWTKEQAGWFFLTGSAPPVVPITSKVEVAYDENGQPMRAELVFRVQVFLTHRSAERALARARRLALRRQGVRGAFPLEERTLALFQFVEEQTERDAGVRPSWGTLLDRWDETQRKEWRYGQERSHLRRDYERARRLLTQASKARKTAQWVSTGGSTG